MSKNNSKKSNTPSKIVEEEKQEELKISLSIVKEMMKVQQDTMLACFNNNIKSLSEKVDNIMCDVQDLKTSLNYIGADKDEKLGKVDIDISKIKNEFVQLTNYQAKIYNDTKELKKKSVELEDRNRRNNLRVDGIVENENEKWEESKEKVLAIFRNNLNINKNIIIERAHRVGPKKDGRHRTIVCRLLNFNDKELIQDNLKKLKDTSIYINEDFSEETCRLRKELFEQQKMHRDEGRYAKVVYNQLIVREFRNARNHQDDTEL